MDQKTLVVRSAAIATFAAALLGLLASLGLTHFTDAQNGAVGTFVLVTATLIVAVVAHLWPTTAQEPVAVGVALIAWVNGLVVVGNVFLWWSLTAAQQGYLTGAVNALLALVGVFVIRRHTTPAQAALLDRQAAVAHAQSIALRRPETPVAPQEPMP